MTDSICSICYENLDENSHTLKECNHTFHTECLIKWFRVGTHKCPYCKDSGPKKEIQNVQFDNQELNINLPDDWELNDDVQIYYNTDEQYQTIDIISKAYYQRDLHFNKNIINTFQFIITKLSLSDELIKKEIKNIYKKNCIDKIKIILEEYDSNISNNEIKINYLNYQEFYNEQMISNEYYIRKEKYAKMENELNNNNHIGLYNCLSKNDLWILGW